VDGGDLYEGHVSDHDCEDVTTVPQPPEIEVSKVALDPVVCVSDTVRFVASITNTGSVPIVTFVMTDTYDTTYLESLSPETLWGPDDGELVLGYPPGDWEWEPGVRFAPPFLFHARAETPSTVDEFQAMVNDDPTTERSDTAAVTILPEPGPCVGNLVANGGFEEGLTGWDLVGGPRIGDETYSGASSLLLGILPSEIDAWRIDAVYQVVSIPADAHHATLSFWYNVDNLEDDDVRFNFFGAAVQEMETGWTYEIVPPTVDSWGWQQATWAIPSHLIGHDIAVGFAAFNDGAHAPACHKLWAYVDDVEVCVSRCGPEAPPDPPPLPDPPPDEPPPPSPDQPPVACWKWNVSCC